MYYRSNYYHNTPWKTVYTQSHAWPELAGTTCCNKAKAMVHGHLMNMQLGYLKRKVTIICKDLSGEDVLKLLQCTQSLRRNCFRSLLLIFEGVIFNVLAKATIHGLWLCDWYNHLCQAQHRGRHLNVFFSLAQVSAGFVSATGQVFVSVVVYLNSRMPMH